MKIKNTSRKKRVDHLECSFEKINKKLDWKPKYLGQEGLIQRITKFINWFKESEGHIQYKGYDDYIY